MGGRRLRQRFEIVTAFQHRDDAALRAHVGDRHDLARHPAEIRLDQVQVGERVAPMRIEACRYHDQVGLEIPQPGQNDLLEGFAELRPAVAGAQGRVDDGVVLAALAHRPGTRIERHLVGRAIHHAGIGPENLLRAVAVMDVEIDDRDALQAVPLLRMPRRDRHIVEEAETHGPRGLGMVAGRAHRHERIGGPFFDHLVDRQRRAAGPAQRRLEAAGRHGGVGIEPHESLLRGGRLDFPHIVERVAKRDGFERGGRRLHAGEVLELLVFERLLDRAQTVGPFRMAGRGQVVEAGRVGDQQGGHETHYWFASDAGRGPH